MDKTIEQLRVDSEAANTKRDTQVESLRVQVEDLRGKLSWIEGGGAVGFAVIGLLSTLGFIAKKKED